jgi:hypothetical protein
VGKNGSYRGTFDADHSFASRIAAELDISRQVRLALVAPRQHLSTQQHQANSQSSI